MNERIFEKLKTLADAAKYDVSCASSGSTRKNSSSGLGNSEGMGICHSYTEDGRCVSLLKVLMTNYCIYDCAYCVSRASNDVKRVAFTIRELVDLTIHFYRRNYIEGLFLSSGIFKNADYTNERLIRVAKMLRTEENFHGYIHLKIIPNCSPELISEAGVYADRLSVNLEIPSEESLKKIAPEKTHEQVYLPMNYLRDKIYENQDERKKLTKVPLFAPAGQSTQLVVGASPESDKDILTLASSLYKDQNLRRVYYSGYIPIDTDSRIPVLPSPPLVRENRLYQADWLMRIYGFDVSEIVSEKHPQLEQQIDPKLAYALRNYHLFPIDINKSTYEMILRVPGIGVKSAKMIISARRHRRLRLEHLKSFGIALNRAKYFIDVPGNLHPRVAEPERVKLNILNLGKKNERQMSLFS